MPETNVRFNEFQILVVFLALTLSQKLSLALVLKKIPPE